MVGLFFSSVAVSAAGWFVFDLAKEYGPRLVNWLFGLSYRQAFKIILIAPDLAQSRSRSFASSPGTFSHDRPNVRFTPESGHVRCTSPCPLSAKSGQTVALGALQVI